MPYHLTRRHVLSSLSMSAICNSAPVHAANRLLPFGCMLDPPALKSGTQSREQIEELLRPLLRTSDRDLFRFAVDAYQQCILDKIRPAQPPFQHAWIVPGGPYVGQWLWDTAFVADLLAVLPGMQDVLRGVYQNYWDNCDRWNASRPAYAHGMIANFISPDEGTIPKFSGKNWKTFPAFSQAPLVAWGVERVFLRNKDLDLVRTALPYLEAFHDWYWRERDVTNVGLIAVGSYSGEIQQARDETYDNEVDLDSLQLTPHPTRHSAEEGSWYGDIFIPANTAYLLLSEASLMRLALAAGDQKLVARRKPFLDRGRESMRKHMWDEESGCFLAVRRESLAKIRNATIGGFIPLMAKVPTQAQANRMAQRLESAAWATPLPIPTVARNDPAFVSDKFWRGDVWPATVYQVVFGLAEYGHHNLAAKIADANIANAMKVGINERYDSLTGKPAGTGGLGMSASLLTMALDGFSPSHIIKTAE